MKKNFYFKPKKWIIGTCILILSGLDVIASAAFVAEQSAVGIFLLVLRRVLQKFVEISYNYEETTDAGIVTGS